MRLKLGIKTKPQKLFFKGKPVCSPVSCSISLYASQVTDGYFKSISGHKRSVTFSVPVYLAVAVLNSRLSAPPSGTALARPLPWMKWRWRCVWPLRGMSSWPIRTSSPRCCHAWCCAPSTAFTWGSNTWSQSPKQHPALREPHVEQTHWPTCGFISQPTHTLKNVDVTKQNLYFFTKGIK